MNRRQAMESLLAAAGGIALAGGGRPLALAASSPTAATGTGATGIVDVREVGAAGDGVHDDTAAIQAALTSGAGGIVYVPRGTYLVSSAVTVPANTTVTGAGRTSVLLLAGGSFNNYTFMVGSGCHIQDITLNGNAARQSQTPHGFLGYRIDGSRFVRCYAEQWPGLGIFFSDCRHIVLDTCEASSCGTNGTGYAGINFSYDTNRPEYALADSWIINCLSENNGLDGFSATQGGIQIIGCRGMGNGTRTGAAGIYVGGPRDVLIASNVVKGNTGNGIDIANARRVTILGNQASGSGSVGISIANCTDCVIDSNIAYNNGQRRLPDQDSGVNIWTNSRDVVVSSNRCFDDQATQTQMYGIATAMASYVTSETVDASGVRIIIANNDVAGNGKSPGLFVGGGVTVVDSAGFNPVGSITPPVSPLASGAVYQNTYGVPLTIYQPVSLQPSATAAATCAVALGPENPPPTIYTDARPARAHIAAAAGFQGAASAPPSAAGASAAAADIVTQVVRVPPGYYFSFTTALASLGAPAFIGE